MNVQMKNIISVTDARGKLGDLTEAVSGEEYILLTKGGEPQAALVDVAYLAKLEDAVKKLYQKTYIDPKLLPYTREFSDEEISEWLANDKI